MKREEIRWHHFKSYGLPSKEKGGRAMSKIWSGVAGAVRALAVKGAGFRSIGFMFAPKVPNALK